jgi:hypothetical protein
MGKAVRGLTLHRPWSHALAHLGKRIENRPWRTPQPLIGQYLALHAGKKYDDYGRLSIRDITGVDPPDEFACPQGIVAVCKVKGCFCFDPERRETNQTLADFVARNHPGQERWIFGPYCWVLDEVVAIEPVPCKGSQGLWSIPEPALVMVRERWDAARKAA